MKIFVTGGSGFVGASLLPLLVRDVKIETIYLLLRPGNADSSEIRLETILRKLFVEEDLTQAKAKIQGVSGDLTEENMGLTQEAYDHLSARVTHVCHIGASTDFGAPLDESRRVNVQGTQRVLDFCETSKVKNSGFVRLDYVSTAFVAGVKSGRVREEDLDRGQLFANAYEQSKFEAEQLVLTYREKFPVVVTRPSIVVGDSRNGFTPHFKVLYWPLVLLSKNLMPFIPSKSAAKLDIVPVDYVARGIYTILKSPEALNKTFYLSAGHKRVISIKKFLADTYRLTNIIKRPMIPVWVVEMLMWKPFRWILSKSIWSTIELGSVYRGYLIGSQVEFDSRVSEEFLKSKGLASPPYWDLYKEALFGYCMETKWGRKLPKPEVHYRNPERG
jgi:thioester reductase-like protein